jgi:hypothetical protein
MSFLQLSQPDYVVATDKTSLLDARTTMTFACVETSDREEDHVLKHVSGPHFWIAGGCVRR